MNGKELWALLFDYVHTNAVDAVTCTALGFAVDLYLKGLYIPSGIFLAASAVLAILSAFLKTVKKAKRVEKTKLRNEVAKAGNEAEV